MKSYSKLFVMACMVLVSAAFLSACADKTPPPPPPAPEIVKPNS